ncbi:hypothetical protein [Nocardia transvalensis]|uniref:hypothetical protein n=1 Tax=Nocardia transvalensis TaxID=37333 RepID=UPI0018932A2B|nr:hypothetical protein [Nocardia transvalensis]MBF6331100.1 hypothetical protein [Nocardia transvalensis]
MGKIALRLTVVLLTIASSAALSEVVAGAAEPRRNAGERYMEMLEVSFPKVPEARTQITPSQYYYIGEAMCVRADMEDDVLEDLDKLLKDVIPTYKKPASSKSLEDPVSEARQRVFGDEEFTNEVRKAMCAAVHDPDLTTFHEYIETREEMVEERGYTLDPEFKDPDTIMAFWQDKIDGYGMALKPWLPIDLDKAD